MNKEFEHALRQVLRSAILVGINTPVEELGRVIDGAVLKVRGAIEAFGVEEEN